MTFRRALGSALVIGLLVVGCAGPPAAPEPAASTQPSPSVDASQLDPARLSAGGSLRASIPSLPSTWNPWHPDASRPEFQFLLDPMRSRAFVLDPQGAAQPDPDQVVDAETTHTDVTTVRLTLNPKAVWGDGTPVTARDWIATWRAFGSGEFGEDARGWDRVADVSGGSDDRQVVVRYSTVDPDWAQPLIDGPARAESVASKEAFRWGSFRADWTAGPFVAEHVDEKQGVITLGKNPHWWGSEPRLDHIYFRVLSDAATPASFGNDELDWLTLGMDLDAAQRVRTASDAAIRVFPAPSGRELVITKKGALSDIAVRRALLRAVDPDAVAAAGLGEFAADAKRWANQLILPSQPGYSDQAVATGTTFDPSAAGAALSKAGWFGSLKLQAGGDQRAQAEAAEIARQLEAVGLTITVVDEGGDLVLRSRTVSAFPFAELGEIVPANDPNAQSAAQRVATETQLVKRSDLAAQVARTLWLRAELLPLYQEPIVCASKNKLTNVTEGGFSHTQWENVGWAR